MLGSKPPIHDPASTLSLSECQLRNCLWLIDVYGRALTNCTSPITIAQGSTPQTPRPLWHACAKTMELHSMRTCRPACPGASARHRACANLGSLAAQQRRYRTSLVLRSASTVELLPADSATQASPPAADAEPSTSDAEAPAQFNWYKQWYPVRIVQELDPSVPHPVMLLGLRLVLWKEGNTWRWVAPACQPGHNSDCMHSGCDCWPWDGCWHSSTAAQATAAAT
jgi:hypothetical protein